MMNRPVRERFGSTCPFEAPVHINVMGCIGNMSQHNSEATQFLGMDILVVHSKAIARWLLWEFIMPIFSEMASCFFWMCVEAWNSHLLGKIMSDNNFEWRTNLPSYLLLSVLAQSFARLLKLRDFAGERCNVFWNVPHCTGSLQMHKVKGGSNDLKCCKMALVSLLRRTSP